MCNYAVPVSVATQGATYTTGTASWCIAYNMLLIIRIIYSLYSHTCFTVCCNEVSLSVSPTASSVCQLVFFKWTGRAAFRILSRSRRVKTRRVKTRRVKNEWLCQAANSKFTRTGRYVEATDPKYQCVECISSS